MCCLHPLVLLEILQVNQRKRAGGRLPWPSGAMNNLDWLTAIETKSRPQDLMSSHYLMHAALQSLHIQLALQSSGAGNEVDGAPRLQLIQEPEALLGKRE